MEKQQTTYGDLRRRKAEIRNEIEKSDFSNYDEYRCLLQRIKDAELWLLFRIVCLVAVVVISGCNSGKCVGTLFKGIGTDVEQLNQGYMDRHGR